MKTNTRQTGIAVGLQFAGLIILLIFIGTSYYLHTSLLGRAGFWLMKGYFLERFILFSLFILIICVLAGIWAAREIITYRRNHVVTGALYGFSVLCLGSLFLPIYLSIKCALLHHCAVQRFLIRSYFEHIPWHLLVGLLPMVLLGILFGIQIKNRRSFQGH